MAERQAPPEHARSVRYSLDLEIGEIALGHRLVARAISLIGDRLFFEYAFVPGVAASAREEVFVNMYYDADVSPANWNYESCWSPEGGESSEGDVHYARPPVTARIAWFDFFRPDFFWEEHIDREPDSEYLANRVARLTVDLSTGEAKIES
jgi:hypothetical protein